MVMNNEVLEFFRGELSLAVTFIFKPIPIELDTPLQGYAEWDELPYALMILEKNITLMFQSLILRPITRGKEKRSIETGLPTKPSNKCQNRLLCECLQSQPEQVTGCMIDCMLTEDTGAIRC